MTFQKKGLWGNNSSWNIFSKKRDLYSITPIDFPSYDDDGRDEKLIEGHFLWKL